MTPGLHLPSLPIFVLIAAAILAVGAFIARNQLLAARSMIVGGWFLFAVSSPTGQIPQVVRPVSNAMFALGALLHWVSTREDTPNRRDPNRRIALSTRCLLIYAVFVLMGSAASPDGPSNLVRGVQGVLIIGTAFYAVASQLTVALLTATWLGAMINVGLTVVGQKQEVDTFGAPTGRLAGSMQPNHLTFAAAEVMIGVMWALGRDVTVTVPFWGRMSLRWPLIGCGLVSTYALYASESRTAWLAVLPAMLIAWFSTPHQPGTRTRAVVFGLLALVTLSPVVVPTVLNYFNRDKSEESITSLTGRTDFWPLAVDLIEQRPIIGWGPNVIASSVGEKFQEVLPGVDQAHNSYLEAGLQAGVIGAVAFAVSLVAMMVGSFRLPGRDDVRMLVISGTILTFIFTFTESNPAWFGDMFIVYVLCAAMYGDRLPLRPPLRMPPAPHQHHRLSRARALEPA